LSYTMRPPKHIYTLFPYTTLFRSQEGVIKIGKTSEKELQIEGLIKSKGFDDALVFLTDEDVKVIVSADELKEEDTVRILDILKSETKYDMNNIKIMKKQ